MDAVSVYFEDILIPTLKRFGVSEKFIGQTCEVVGNQMHSLLKHWDDIKFRKTILFLGMEEGLFYEPDAKADVKAFVVVTLRNSPVETLQSDDFSKAGLKNIISDEQLKTITSDAIRYFNKQDFSSLCTYAKTNFAGDYYLNTLVSHPVTKEALQSIANCSAKSVGYRPVSVVLPFNIDLSSADIISDSKMLAFFDGYSREIDPQLAKTLRDLAEIKSPIFVSDSFKYVTRNFSKLMDIIEFLLTRNIAFVTANVYLENGYAERRIKLLRASHGKAAWLEKLFQTDGLGYKHKSALKYFTK